MANTIIRALAIALIFPMLGCASETSGRISAADILAKVRPNHPRLMLTPAALAEIKSDLPKDAWLRRQYGSQKERADRILSQPVSVYKLHGRDDMVDVSRQVLERVSCLALAYRIEGDRKYLDRCRAELDDAAGFQDWGPRQFLDTAEMTAAFAIAYDWLYDDWTPEQRRKIREAIAGHGLKPGLEAYARQNWPNQADNHNTVNNGGLALGALAVADEEPALAGRILSLGLDSVQHSLSQFAPDGAWPEGPMYWGYATEYASMYLDSLETACGTDFGLGDLAGIGRTGWFAIYNNGPIRSAPNDASNGAFNYADANDDHDIRSGPQLLWMAKRFHDPRLAQYEIDFPNGRVSALDVIWGAGIEHRPWQSAPPDHYFPGVELATMRDGWEKPNGWFVGFKAGSNNVSHSHLDVGSFVLENKGVRWAIDFGPDDTDLPGYSHDDDDEMRWSYYRLRAEGHNTLAIDPGPKADQDHTRAGKITAFAASPQGVELAADLAEVYPDAEHAVRRISFLREKSVEIRDEVKLKKPGDIWWFMQTRADAKVSHEGKTVELAQDGKTLTLAATLPEGCKFEIGPAEPLPTSPHPAGQSANRGATRIAIHVHDVQAGTIDVVFK